MTNMTCNICCEDFTKRDRVEIQCPRSDCGFVCCSSCVRKYICECINEPHCMNCKFSYEDDFLQPYMTKKFMNNEYKQKQGDIFLQLEQSLIPETQTQAKEYMERKRRTEEYNAYRKSVLDTYDPLIEKYRKLLSDAQINKEKELAKAHTLLIKKAKKEVEKKNFMMKCQVNDCRGYLSSSYKCQLCENTTCSKCFMVITENHSCLEEHIQSAQMIKKETKPCPNCVTPIYKIEGCDQMWCTSCNNAFSWKHGTIIHNNIHNPHYFDYLQKHNNGQRPRNPNDVLCGGIPDLGHLLSMTSSLNRSSLITEINQCIGKIQRFITHIQMLFLTQQQTYDYEYSRIQYMVKEIELTKWKSQILKLKKQEARDTYERQMMDLVVQVGCDLLRNYLAYFDTPVTNKETYILNLYQYTKELLKSFINVLNYNNELKIKKCKALNMSCHLFYFKIKTIPKHEPIMKYDYQDEHGLYVDYYDSFNSQDIIQKL